MRTKKVKRVKFLKGEKFMFFLIIFLGLIVMPSAWVYTKALLSESNIVIIMPVNLYNAHPGNNVSKISPSTLKIRHRNLPKFTQKFHP